MATSEWTDNIPAVANQISTDIAAIEKNFEEIKEILDDLTSGTVGTTDTSSFELTKLTTQNIWIGANDMWAWDSGGPSSANTHFVANDLYIKHFAFDGTTEEYVNFVRAFPEGWDRGTIKAKFYWLPSTGCSAGDTVEWEICAQAISNDDDMSGAFGTSQVISDTVLAGENTDLHITAATPAITIGGTPALGDLIAFQISRNVGGTDDMTEDARLYGVLLQITVDQSVTAW